MGKNPARHIAQKMIDILNNVENIPFLSENAYNTALKFSWENTYKIFRNMLEEL